MEWFFFLFGLIVWIFLFYLARENSSFPRLFVFFFVSIIFGIMLLGGINFPSGFTYTTSGSTTTQTIQYTTYQASTQGANSFPLLWGIAWGLIVWGIIGSLYAFSVGYKQLFGIMQGKKETI